MNNADKPAYPTSEKEWDVEYEIDKYENFSGLTKRERFAMAAMQGIMSDVNHWKEIRRMAKDQDKKNSKVLSELSLECADALLNELEDTDEDTTD